VKGNGIALVVVVVVVVVAVLIIRRIGRRTEISFLGRSRSVVLMLMVRSAGEHGVR
jgi:high-affinity Fe2+/Pb2+ permease